jgi:hypothetical protein
VAPTLAHHHARIGQALPVSLTSALLFLASMIAVLAWFWWLSRPAQIHRSAVARQKLFWIRNRRTIEQDIVFQQRMARYVMLPAAVLFVLVAVAALVQVILTGG